MCRPGSVGFVGQGRVRVYDAAKTNSTNSGAVEGGTTWKVFPDTTMRSRPQLIQIEASDEGADTNLSIDRVEYVGRGRYGIELSADTGAQALVVARQNYWGVFPNVAGVIYEFVPTTIDFQEFRAAEIPGTGPRQPPGYDP
jgi:ABC-type transport system substrate-binding protein